MEQSNLVEKWLRKGDRLLPKYKNFAYDELDQTQLFWLNQLTWFTKLRERIINRYNGTVVSQDVKIMFLDQHSFKIGHAIFYNLEASR